MAVDLSKIRPGDEVTVRLDVGNLNENGLWASVPGWHPSEALNLLSPQVAAHIVSHTPRAIQPGDRVRPRPPTPVISPEIGTVIHVHNGSAWVAWEPIPTNNGDVQPVYALSSLEPA